MAENDERHGIFFMQLVFTFQSAAWQQMGKMKNPITDKIEKDLNQARYSIDMLEMIRAKTDGNLTEEEKRLLDGTISQLQLNYVDEFNKQQQEGAVQEKEEKPPEAGEPEKKAEAASAPKKAQPKPKPKAKKKSTGQQSQKGGKASPKKK